MDKKLRKIEVIKKSTTTTTEICQNWDLEPGLPSCGMLFSTGKVSFTMERGSSHVRGDSKIKKCLILQKTTGGILKCTHKGRWLFRPGLYLFLIVFPCWRGKALAGGDSCIFVRQCQTTLPCKDHKTSMDLKYQTCHLWALDKSSGSAIRGIWNQLQTLLECLLWKAQLWPPRIFICFLISSISADSFLCS